MRRGRRAIQSFLRALVGGGPAALVAAIALARGGVRTSVFERDAHPEVAPRFNPNRSYTIDISGHGLKALRHIDACAYFDDRMIQFKGLKIPGGRTEEWTLPSWTGSRGDGFGRYGRRICETYRCRFFPPIGDLVDRSTTCHC